MDYCNRIGAKPRSMRTAIVEEHRGTYWKDRAVIRFGKDGQVKAPPNYEPTQEEAARIQAEFSEVKWPEIIPTQQIMNPHPHFAKTEDKNTFIFYDTEKNIRMIQLRFETDTGGKVYVGYTYWSDGIWRMLEPEGLLPLWGIDRYDYQSEVVIHEGAKAARAVADMVKNKTIGLHPWGEELEPCLHLGWIGGAQNPSRTDWSFLREKNFKMATIILDRDRPGEKALKDISKAINMPARYVKFPDNFPHGFDMADDWPDKYFKDIGGTKVYTGPMIEEMSGPATWMTNEEIYHVKSKRGEGTKLIEKRKYSLSDNAGSVALWIESLERFMFVHDPKTQYSPTHFNANCAYFSDVPNLAKLYLESEKSFTANLTYDPSNNAKVIVDDGLKLNLYRPSPIRPHAGDPEPFLEFMYHLVPILEDRNALLKWIATLISHPEIRMRYACLLVSEQTGIGKTTLAEKIIVPLVGRANCSFPREGALDGDFNDWCGKKRFAYIAEIYQGHNFKVTNALKSAITDGMIRVNAKYDREFEIQNWIHIMASSNSMKAIHLDLEDRRWMIPEVNEIRWKPKKFEKFYQWIGTGGLRIIRHWADNYGDYVRTGDHAPMTNRKFEVINEGKSVAQVMAEKIGHALKETSAPFVISDVELHKYITDRQKGRTYDSKLDLRKACINAGGILYRGKGDGRWSFKTGFAYALVNDAARVDIDASGGDPGVVQNIHRKCGGISMLIEDEI
jgi:hypothetical protein